MASKAKATPDTPFPRVSTGIAGLDTILGGGVMRGGIYIVQGDPGAGKTILANQIGFHHFAAITKANALFVTLLAENHARMLSNIRPLSFFDGSRIPDRLTYLSALSEFREGGLKALTDLLRREIMRRRSTVLVLDGLVSAQASEMSNQAFKEFVHSLQELALATDCTMFLITNVSIGVSPEQTMVDGLIELSDRSYGSRSESDLHVRKFRGSPFLRGRHSYKITNDGIRVYPRIETLLAHPTQPDQGRADRHSTGVAKLDELLGGGLPGASTTMVMGPSGAGKTTLGMHFLSKSSKKEPGLLFGFYETPARILSNTAQNCPQLPPLVASGVVEILWQPPTDDMLDAYGQRLLEAVHRRKVRRLFIDGLSGLMKAAVEPGRMDHFFTALANELRVLKVTTVYTLEVPDILGPAIRVPLDDISSIAENMVLLRYIELRSQLYRLLSVLKVRGSNFDASLHEFKITGKGMEIENTADTAESIMSSFGQRAEGLTPSKGASRRKSRGG
jgi:circadian clock protein KaiC